MKPIEALSNPWRHNVTYSGRWFEAVKWLREHSKRPWILDEPGVFVKGKFFGDSRVLRRGK